MTQTQPLTVTLRSGMTVLAKMYNGSPSALTYANRTQANAAAAKIGGVVVGHHPFYVAPRAEYDAFARRIQGRDAAPSPVEHAQ